MLKTCKKCNLAKPLSDFHKDKRRKHGAYLYCKNCHNQYARERYSRPEIKQKIKSYVQRKRKDATYIEDNKRRNKQYYKSVWGRAKTLFNSARRRSNGDLTVTLESIFIKMSIGICEVTGIPFQFDNSYQIEHGTKKNPYSPSIDRINPKIGYTCENTRVVIWQYNLMKGEMSDSELFSLCEIIVGHKS